MFEKMDPSGGKVLGYKVAGTVTKADYETFVPEVDALVEREGSIRMLLDLTEFKWEAVGAWLADWKFGRKYHEKIEKMALVGDKKWEEWLAKLAEPLYAREVKLFHSAERDAAWKWVRD